MELQAIQSGGHGRAPSPMNVQDSRPAAARSEPAAELAPSARVAQARAAEPVGTDRLRAAQERTHGRLAEALDLRALSPRQQQALEQVKAEFDQQLARLQGGGFEADGAAKAELTAGLDQVYGSFLAKLQAILGATVADAGGLALDKQA